MDKYIKKKRRIVDSPIVTKVKKLKSEKSFQESHDLSDNEDSVITTVKEDEEEYEDDTTEKTVIDFLKLMMPRTDPSLLPWKDIKNINLDLKYVVLFPKLVADKIFMYLEKILHFDESIQKARIFGKWITIPRKQVAFGDEGLTYTFSGNTVPALPWTGFLLEMRRILREATGWDFNFVLINRYKDGSDHIGAHRDDEKDLDANAPIASLSFGQERDFVFKHCSEMSRNPKSVRTNKIPVIGPVQLSLEHGSLLLMNPPTNEYWFHSLPIRRNVLHPRLNMTFRKILSASEQRRASWPSSARQPWKRYVSSPTASQYGKRTSLPSTSVTGKKSEFLFNKPKIHKRFTDDH